VKLFSKYSDLCVGGSGWQYDLGLCVTDRRTDDLLWQHHALHSIARLKIGASISGKIG